MLARDSILLDAQRPGPADPAGALLFTRPARTLRADDFAEVRPLLAELSRAAEAGQWCAGYLAYEAAYGLDPAGFPDPPKPRAPLAWFGVFDEPARLSPEDVERWLPQGRIEIVGAAFRLEQDVYRGHVEAIRRLILEGEVYQINLTAPLDFGFEGDPLALYAELRRKQRVPYGGVIRVDDRWIVSLSPELFVRRDGDRLAARPMKGTVPRGATLSEDRRRAAWLGADEKNRAENLMIVDLLRNDLSRVSRPGSVRVPRLFEVERYETLWQMTSTVEAEARAGVSVEDVLGAVFPCGSVTGAPKRRAMQLIREIEGEPRGVYCGAIGVVRPGGDFVFNVAIRTLEIEEGRGRMGIGSGVVWDSDPEAEYRECLLKARFLTGEPPPEFALLETMRAEDGRIPLLQLHLARLREAAEYFDFSLDEAAVRRALDDLGQGIRRVRLTLARDGAVEVASTPVHDAELALRTAIVYPEPLDTDDPFFRHKTTNRSFYDRALQWARERDADEAILLNQRGEVADGSFTSVWVRRADRLVTAPLEAGGLPGVFREHLLTTREDTVQAPLRDEDLYTADRVLLSNAARGLMEVEVIRA